MKTLYYTLEHLTGHLKGLKTNHKITFPTDKDIKRFIDRTKNGFKTYEKNNVKIIDKSFKKYWRY